MKYEIEVSTMPDSYSMKKRNTRLGNQKDSARMRSPRSEEDSSCRLGEPLEQDSYTRGRDRGGTGPPRGRGTATYTRSSKEYTMEGDSKMQIDQIIVNGRAKILNYHT